jgi:hypothetical protein
MIRNCIILALVFAGAAAYGAIVIAGFRAVGAP